MFGDIQLGGNRSKTLHQRVVNLTGQPISFFEDASLPGRFG
jgi:hypothetical protein